MSSMHGILQLCPDTMSGPLSSLNMLVQFFYIFLKKMVTICKHAYIASHQIVAFCDFLGKVRKSLTKNLSNRCGFLKI